MLPCDVPKTGIELGRNQTIKVPGIPAAQRAKLDAFANGREHLPDLFPFSHSQEEARVVNISHRPIAISKVTANGRLHHLQSLAVVPLSCKNVPCKPVFAPDPQQIYRVIWSVVDEKRLGSAHPHPPLGPACVV